MGGKKFTIGEAIGTGWRLTIRNIGLVIGLWVIILAIFVPMDPLAKMLEARSALLPVIINIVAFVLNFLFQMGLIKIALALIDGRKGMVRDLFNCLPRFLSYFISSILYGLIIVAGLLLLIVPGIIWAVRFQFYPYYIIEKGLGPVESLKMSFRISSGQAWHLLLMDIAFTGVVILGLLALGVGIIVAVPTIMIGTAHVYRKLLSYQEQGEPSAPVPA